MHRRYCDIISIGGGGGRQFIQPRTPQKISLFSSSSRKLYYYTMYRGKEKTVAATAENTIPPGVRKSMVGRRRFGSPAVADARTPPPRTGDPFDRNSTHTPARTFVPTGRCIVSVVVAAEFPTPLLLLGNIVFSYTICQFSQCLSRRYAILSLLDFCRLKRIPYPLYVPRLLII